MAISPNEIVDCVFRCWQANESREAIAEQLALLGLEKTNIEQAIEMTCTGYSRAVFVAGGMDPHQFASDFEDNPILVAACEKATRQFKDVPPSKRRSLNEIDRLLGSCDATIRRQVVFEVGSLSRAVAVPRLLAALEDGDLYVRIYAIQALSQLKAGDGVARVSEILVSEQDGMILSNAIRYLATIGDRTAVGPLIQATSSPNDFVRHDSAWALGELGDPRAIPALEALLEDQTTPVEKDELGLTKMSSLFRVCDQAEKSLVKIRQLSQPWWKFW